MAMHTFLGFMRTMHPIFGFHKDNAPAARLLTSTEEWIGCRGTRQYLKEKFVAHLKALFSHWRAETEDDCSYLLEGLRKTIRKVLTPVPVRMKLLLHKVKVRIMP
jgi:hypothetical protein